MTVTHARTYTLCVAQYHRGHSFDGQQMPLHWALFLLPNATPESLRSSSSGKESADQVDHWGTCYQAIGNSDTFAFSRTEDECMEILTQEYRGCLSLGEIDPKRREEVDPLVQRVPVYRQRRDWNCQNWVLAAVDRLKASELVGENVTSSGVRNDLEDILRAWKP
ncbi:hypothetical protein HYDPIDRAFT_113850 [Hydnomerulius pinastri MD-312]|uniref:Uncharacterized protein n=1 Tax=Hydnomerulius pinastri MD-312 TaxID=994086 RepID=A0A0C9W6X2_9AGAM|nr:hypothetical protein HYDPIDRAFT_113850 [Hydnomerulius pinastri MD-312]